MAVRFMCAVVCEGCGVMSRHVEGTAEDARRSLWADGWRRNGQNGDRCPSCCEGRVLRNYLPGAPPGYCDCGCGERTAIADRSRARAGWVKGQPMPRIPGHRTPAPVRDPDTGCLLWQGRIEEESGYGRLGAGFAHRVLWQRANGPIPQGYEVDHLCRVRPCVELSHLDCIPAEEHYARTNPRGDTCGKGHDDWRPRRNGGRYCRQCNRERDAAYREAS